MKVRPPSSLADEATSLAESWLNRANELLTPEEIAYQGRMKRLLANPRDKVILTRLIDQSFRSRNFARVADQINSLLKAYGIPGFFSAFDKLLLYGFCGIGRFLPQLSVPR